MRTWKNSKFSDYALKKLSGNDKDFNEVTNYYKFGKKDIEDNTKDLFHSFFSKNQELDSNPDPFFKQYHDIIKDTAEFKNLQVKTQKSQALSYIATKEFQKKMYDHYVQYSSNSNTNESDPDKNKKIVDYMTKNRDEIRRDLRTALKNAESSVDNGEATEAILGAGCDASESIGTRNANAQEIIKFAEKMRKNESFKKIIEMAGRKQRSARAKIATTIPDIGSPIGIEIGGDLTKAIPSELAMLDGSEMEDLFWLNLYEGKILQHKTEEVTPQENGTFLICLDESGSMSDMSQENRAMVFGMYLIAKNQNRKLSVLRFDTQVIRHDINTPEDLMEFAESEFMDGGTNFERPLTMACDIIEHEDVYKKADIIFVTDGVAKVSDELKQRMSDIKEQLQFKIITLSMCGINDTIKKFSDLIFDMTSKHKFEENIFSL